MLTYKQSITNLPTYNDGVFKLFQIKQTEETYPLVYIKDTGEEIWFEELSISKLWLLLLPQWKSKRDRSSTSLDERSIKEVDSNESLPREVGSS